MAKEIKIKIPNGLAKAKFWLWGAVVILLAMNITLILQLRNIQTRQAQIERTVANNVKNVNSLAQYVFKFHPLKN
jgi:hypothetical protein